MAAQGAGLLFQLYLFLAGGSGHIPNLSMPGFLHLEIKLLPTSG